LWIGLTTRPLRLFDTKILQVIDQRETRRLLEAALQCPFRYSRTRDEARDRTRLPEVLAQPGLAVTDDRIRMRLLPHERLIRQLTFVVHL
jgi:hypothetical protein